MLCCVGRSGECATWWWDRHASGVADVMKWWPGLKTAHFNHSCLDPGRRRIFSFLLSRLGSSPLPGFCRDYDQIIIKYIVILLNWRHSDFWFCVFLSWNSWIKIDSGPEAIWESSVFCRNKKKKKKKLEVDRSIHHYWGSWWWPPPPVDFSTRIFEFEVK